MARGGQGGREQGIDAFSSEGRRNSQEDNKMVLDDLKESLQWERTLMPEQEQSPVPGHHCPRSCSDGTRPPLAAGGRTWSGSQPPANSLPYNRKHGPFSPCFPPIKRASFKR